MKKIKFSLLSAFFCAGMLLVTACNKDDDNNTEQSDNTEQNNKTVSVLGVTLDKTSVSLEVGATLTLTATVSPENADNKAITWSSSDEAVATVDENGKVTAVAVGNVTITAKAGDKTAECKVTVSAKVIAVNSITVDESSLSLKVGDNKTLTATVSPENATNKTVIWSSSDEAVATVDETGKVTAKAVGTATIKATANDGSEVFGSCEVTVKGQTYSILSEDRKDRIEMGIGGDGLPEIQNITFPYTFSIRDIGGLGIDIEEIIGGPIVTKGASSITLGSVQGSGASNYFEVTVNDASNSEITISVSIHNTVSDVNYTTDVTFYILFD